MIEKEKTIETDNLISIQEVCLEALIYSKLIGVIGEPGYGKTTGLQYFTKSYKEQGNVYYVRLRKSMTTRNFYSEVLNSITEESGTSKGSVFSMINRIAFLLNNSGVKNLLIFDEAGRLTKNQWHYVQEVRDLTEKSTGIIIAGPKYFSEKINEWKDKNVEGIPEVYRRINTWVYLKPPTKREIKTIVRAYNITDEEFLKEALKMKNFAELTYLILSYLRIKGK